MALFTTGILRTGLFPGFKTLTLESIFSTSTTFVVPSGVDELTIECIGGGGGGGFTSTGTNFPTNGGGGGAWAKSVISVSPGDTFSIEIGAGGSGGNTSKDGGTTSFFSGATTYCSAVGGNGGFVNTQGIGAAGGLSTSCVFNVDARTGGRGGDSDNNGNGGGGGAAGENGTPAQASTGPGPTPAGEAPGAPGGLGGIGAGKHSGNGGNASFVFRNGASNYQGSNGNQFGGGGGGSWRNGSGNVNGGNGASGAVIITYTINE